MFRLILQSISWLSLAALVVFPALYLAELSVTKDGMKTAMLVATITWFVATPLWMGRKKKEEESS